MPTRPMQSSVALFSVSAEGQPANAAVEQYRADSETDLMRLQFGLSPRQATLTALLFSGRSVKEAAIMLGITEGSARQYLKLIFRKTGARRQADLVRLVSRALT
jgi:DNA-binding CsgD family transcriptional regulator